jgi:hypothetical protein
LSFVEDLIDHTVERWKLVYMKRKERKKEERRLTLVSNRLSLIFASKSSEGVFGCFLGKGMGI